MKIPLFLAVAALFALVSPYATAEDNGAPVPAPATEPAGAPSPGAPPRTRWYRDAGEYLASRSSRALVPTDVTTKIITDAKRFDVSVGKRIPLLTWSEEGPSDAWSFGIDGGMLASLVRYTNEGRLTFATNTFDGMFGLWAGFVSGDGWLALFRTAHLSAHLVDNSPLFLTPIAYSQFWNEVIVGKSFPETRSPSDWNLHLQGSLGFNNTSTPVADQPRATLSADFGYALHGADSFAVIASADTMRAGVSNQPLTYVFFLGMGYLSRPETTHRPFRLGVSHFRGSDYRNQLYFNRQNWTTFELAAEF
jgi:hypothetical protein